MALRKMTENDLKMVLDWRNSPSVRENMYTSHVIQWDEHQKWFEHIKDNPRFLWLIYEEIHPEGVVYFTNIDKQCRKAFWGFYAGDTKAIGIGMRIAYEAMQYAFNDLNLRKLNCEILAFNKVVINQHYKFGFKKEGVFRKDHCKDGEYIDVIRMGIFHDEWKSVEPIIARKICKIRNN